MNGSLQEIYKRLTKQEEEKEKLWNAVSRHRRLLGTKIEITDLQYEKVEKNIAGLEDRIKELKARIKKLEEKK